MYKRHLNALSLTVRITLFIYIPSILLIRLIYQAVFGSSMQFDWVTHITYLGVFLSWVYTRYKYGVQFVEEKDKAELERILSTERWEEIDRIGHTQTVRPRFDYPVNLLINDRVTIEYQDGKIKLSGPLKYVTALGRSIHNEASDKTLSLRSVGRVIAFILFVIIPTFRFSGFTWEVAVLRHNRSARHNDSVLPAENISANSVDNINNGGLAIENEDTIIYLHGNRDIIKTDRSFNYDQMISEIDTSFDSGYFHLVDDWLYYTESSSFNRIRTDGTDKQVLYDLGHVVDIQLIDDTFYFINYADNANIYSLNLDGQDLTRIATVRARELSAYEDELLVTHLDGVDIMSLDGKDSESFYDEAVTDLIRHNDDYYFIGTDNLLYRRSDEPAPHTEAVLSNPVSKYMITDDSIIYTMGEDYYPHPTSGLYVTDHEGTDPEHIYPSDYIDSMMKVGDSILFRASSDTGSMDMMRYDIESGEIDSIYY